MNNCPHCGHDRIYVLGRRGRFCCARPGCRKQFSTTTQTAMRSHKKPLDWYDKILAMHRAGMNSNSISKTGIGTQKAIWTFLKRWGAANG